MYIFQNIALAMDFGMDQKKGEHKAGVTGDGLGCGWHYNAF